MTTPSAPRTRADGEAAAPMMRGECGMREPPAASLVAPTHGLPAPLREGLKPRPTAHRSLRASLFEPPAP